MAVPYFSEIRKVDIQTRYDIGVRWVRRDLAWDRIETIRGVYDFSEADSAINAELANGVNVLAILNYGNKLYNHNPSATNTYPPDTLAYFTKFVTEAVNHFKGRINVWEIWNEPNGPLFWQPHANPKEYGKLVLEAAAAIHHADPNARAMLGGMVGNSDPLFFSQRAWGFTEDLINAYPEIINSIDMFSIHPYTFLQHPAPEDPATNILQTSYIDMIKNFRRIIDKSGGAGKPIWATELGWHSATQSLLFKGITEDMQAAYLVRACVIAFSLGIEKVFPYTYTDGPGDLTNSESHFGIMRYLSNPSLNQPHEPKPGYFAYKNMTAQLSNTSFTQDLRYEMNLPNSVYAYQFNSVIVAWTTQATVQKLSLIKTPTHVYSLNGDELPVTGNVVDLSRMPVYIKM